MEKRLIIANWKARKTTQDALTWLDVVKQAEILTVTYPFTILLAAPYTLLSFLAYEIRERNLPIHLCSQDVSAFSQGSHTGEIPAELVKEFADYSIIGHSERRNELNEQDSMLSKKVEQSQHNKLTPIYCVQNSTEAIPDGVNIVAYEPPGAIGSGHTAGLADVLSVTDALTASSQRSLSILYGGSVDSENVKQFMTAEKLSGVLVGTKSIEGSDFVSLLHAAL